MVYLLKHNLCGIQFMAMFSWWTFVARNSSLVTGTEDGIPVWLHEQGMEFQFGYMNRGWNFSLVTGTEGGIPIWLHEQRMEFQFGYMNRGWNSNLVTWTGDNYTTPCWKGDVLCTFFYANDIRFTWYKSCFMSVLLALWISIARLLRHITAQQWLVLFCSHLFVLCSFLSSQGKVFSAHFGISTDEHFLLLGNSKMLDTDTYSQLQQAVPRGPGTIQCIHLLVVFHSLHACLCGVRTVSGHTVLFSAYTSSWYSIHCMHVYVEFALSVGIRYCSVHTPLCGIPFTACMFMWILCCSWHTFTCGTDFVHDMSSCGTGFVHDTCHHVVLCTLHSMHVHVEFCTVSGHVIQVLFMTRVAMRYFALFTPCMFMWNFALSVGVCGTVELLFKDHLKNKEKKWEVMGLGRLVIHFHGNVKEISVYKKKGVWGG